MAKQQHLEMTIEITGDIGHLTFLKSGKMKTIELDHDGVKYYQELINGEFKK